MTLDVDPGCAPRVRVLVADDHQPIRERLTAILSAHFSVVGSVTDGDQLLDAEADLRPDVVVVDISMPRVSGLEAAAHLRKRGTSAVIVCVSAHPQEEALQAAWDAGALAYVDKVSIVRDLVPAIHAALEGRRFASEPAAGVRNTPNAG